MENPGLVVSGHPSPPHQPPVTYTRTIDLPERYCLTSDYRVAPDYATVTVAADTEVRIIRGLQAIPHAFASNLSTTLLEIRVANRQLTAPLLDELASPTVDRLLFSPDYGLEPYEFTIPYRVGNEAGVCSFTVVASCPPAVEYALRQVATTEVMYEAASTLLAQAATNKRPAR